MQQMNNNMQMSNAVQPQQGVDKTKAGAPLLSEEQKKTLPLGTKLVRK